MIIKNARFLPALTEGFEEESGDLRLRDGRIAEIGVGLSPEAGEQVLDAAGRTLLPGLIDMHVHLAITGGDMLGDNFKALPYRMMETYRFALDSLNAGFTTLRDVGDVNYMVLSLRDFINEGKIPGPRIWGSGKILTPIESGNEYFDGMYEECNSVDEVRIACRRQFSHCADFIKVMASGAISNPGGVPGMTIETEAELTEMVRCARQRNTYVAAHCHGEDSIRLCLKCGVKTIEHATLMDDDIIQELRKGESFIVPTLICSSRIHDTEADFAEFMSRKTGDMLQKRDYWLKKAYEAGLIMGFGTDAGTTENWHGQNADEFIERYERIGMRPIDILKQATIYSAAIMGIDDVAGSIKTGKYADLVIVDGNPDEDIYSVRKGITTVIKGGEIVRSSI